VPRFDAAMAALAPRQQKITFGEMRDGRAE
jgi:hypothetical protein